MGSGWRRQLIIIIIIIIIINTFKHANFIKYIINDYRLSELNAGDGFLFCKLPPPDSFCRSHIVHLFLKLCDDSCTGSTRCHHVKFKQCMFVYRCLHGLAPSYLSDLCTPATVHAHLRSSVTLERSLSIPRTKTKTIGQRFVC